MATTASAVLEEAAKKAKDRAEAIRKEIEHQRDQFEKAVGPLRDELEELEDAIARITGRGGRTRGRRSSGGQRMSPEERETQVYEVILRHPKGVNGKQIADELGISSGTVAAAVNGLIEQNRVKAEGERRARKLLPA